ncbi:MAG: hypothetical protein IKY01_05820 [Prevotella sp.]|nr:hypothetical protein [Prevotella sp.]
MEKIGFSTSHFCEVVPCTVDLLNQAIDSAAVKNVCDLIAQALLKVKQGKMSRTEFENYKKAMKKQLPVLTPHAIFKNGERKNSEAIPSGLSMYDIDHIENPRGYYQSMVADRISELGIVMAYVTPSTEGLRLIFEMPQGMTLAEAQKWMSEQLGDSDYDGSVKDYARCSYLVPRAYLLYLDEEELLKDRQVEAATPQPAKPLEEKAVAQNEASVSPEQQNRNLRIFDLCLKEAGLKPESIDVMGIHNWHNSLVAVLSIGICRLMSQQELLNVLVQRMPNYVKEEDCQRLVNDFYEKYTNSNAPMTLTLRNIYAESMNVSGASKTQKSLTLSSVPPQMPEKLPRLIKLLVSKEPENVRPSVAMGAFPALGAHLHDVHFLYADNTYREATFMHHTMAKTATGKAGVSRVCEAVMKDIEERDQVNRQREQDYKDECARLGSNKQRPDRPDDLVVQMLLSDITIAALNRKGADADGHFIYSLLNEVELFNQVDPNPKKTLLRNIIQTAFDCDWFGQERVGEKSVTARYRLRWNWNTSSTIKRGQDFYQPMLADGSFNRISFSTIIPTDDGKIPKHGFYDVKFMAKLKPYIDRLNAAHGNYDLKKAQLLIDRLNEEAVDTARLSDDDAYEDTSHRAIIIAWLRAMVLYVAEGKWSKEIEDFAMWSFHYDMWCKMTFFGEEMRKQMAHEVVGKSRGPRNMLDMLPTEFTNVDAEAVRLKVGKQDHDPYKMLWTWENRGYIQQDPLTGVYRKTDHYLAKHTQAA